MAQDPRKKPQKILFRIIAFSQNKSSRGIPFRNFEYFQKLTGLSHTESCDLINISPRTLQRRKTSGFLTPDESERVIRAANVFSQVIDHLEGDLEATNQWIREINPSLSGKKPLDCLGTEFGARRVSRLIGRLEHFIPT